MPSYASGRVPVGQVARMLAAAPLGRGAGGGGRRPWGPMGRDRRPRLGPTGRSRMRLGQHAIKGGRQLKLGQHNAPRHAEIRGGILRVPSRQMGEIIELETSGVDLAGQIQALGAYLMGCDSSALLSLYGD